jgi:hypothetical protein
MHGKNNLLLVNFRYIMVISAKAMFMYSTQKNQLRDLDKAEFLALRELCRLSKNLYNVGLYTVRQYFFEERKHLRYESAVRSVQRE